MEKRLEELKSELASREHRVHELATKHEQDSVTIKKLRAEILHAEFDLKEKQAELDMAVQNRPAKLSPEQEEQLARAKVALAELPAKINRATDEMRAMEDAYAKADHERIYLEDQLSRARGDLAQARLAAEMAKKETATVREVCTLSKRRHTVLL